MTMIKTGFAAYPLFNIRLKPPKPPKNSHPELIKFANILTLSSLINILVLFATSYSIEDELLRIVSLITIATINLEIIGITTGFVIGQLINPESAKSDLRGDVSLKKPSEIRKLKLRINLYKYCGYFSQASETVLDLISAKDEKVSYSEMPQKISSKITIAILYTIIISIAFPMHILYATLTEPDQLKIIFNNFCLIGFFGTNCVSLILNLRSLGYYINVKPPTSGA